METKKGSAFIIAIIVVAIAVLAVFLPRFLKWPRFLEFIAPLQVRDRQRIADMDLLKQEQTNYRAHNETYYLHDDYPIPIGKDLPQIPLDPLSTGNVCGSDYIYCNIGNMLMGDEQKFCYYAKLESGGFYAVSQGGSITKTTAPKNLDGCIAP
jgi:hypothetical protein